SAMALAASGSPASARTLAARSRPLGRFGVASFAGFLARAGLPPFTFASSVRSVVAAPSARAALADMRGAFFAGVFFAAAFLAVGFVLVVFLAISMLLSGQETAKPATSGLQGRGRISMSRLQAGQVIRVGGAARRPAS